MKTNPPTSRLYRLFAILINHPIAVTLSISFYVFLLCIIAVLLSSCKTPAVITNNESNHTRDSNYHASIQRIETHDTIVIGPSKSPLKGDFVSSPFKGGTEGVFWVDFGSSPFKGELQRVSDLEGLASRHCV